MSVRNGRPLLMKAQLSLFLTVLRSSVAIEHISI
uniref:Uncharacterized protein n=1 Tax=Arundo donax TaxID=35708 RepID=A0A0A9AA41_ARUDO